MKTQYPSSAIPTGHYPTHPCSRVFLSAFPLFTLFALRASTLSTPSTTALVGLGPPQTPRPPCQAHKQKSQALTGPHRHSDSQTLRHSHNGRGTHGSSAANKSHCYPPILKDFPYPNFSFLFPSASATHAARSRLAPPVAYHLCLTFTPRSYDEHTRLLFGLSAVDPSCKCHPKGPASAEKVISPTHASRVWRGKEKNIITSPCHASNARAHVLIGIHQTTSIPHRYSPTSIPPQHTWTAPSC